MTYGGNISGSGDLVKTGTSNLTLTGTNNYSGTTFIGPFGGSTNIGGGTLTGGVLTVPAEAQLPSWNVPGMVHVSSGSTLAVGNAWSDADVTTLSTSATWDPGCPLGLQHPAWRPHPGPLQSVRTLGLNKLGTNTLTLDSQVATPAPRSSAAARCC